MAPKAKRKNTQDVRQKQRRDLKNILNRNIYFPCDKQGDPVFLLQTVGGVACLMGWAYTTREEIQRRVEEDSLWEEGSIVSIGAAPAKQYLAVLVQTLRERDLDLLDTGRRAYPLTAIGISAFQTLGKDPDDHWGSLLRSSLSPPRLNFLLADVLRRVILVVAPDKVQFLQQYGTDNLVEEVIGKGNYLPPVSQSPLWVVGVKEKEGGFSPFILTFPRPGDEKERTYVGPVIFSDSALALRWAQYAVRNFPDVSVQDLHFMPFTGTGIFKEAKASFPTMCIDRDPDAFLFDGGVFPLTREGAIYGDAQKGEEEGGTRVRLYEEMGPEKFRLNTLYWLARSLGFNEKTGARSS